MIDITCRYAQEKHGQKLHIVPVISGDYNMADTALCGKHVDNWRATFNVPFGHCCHNCMRVNRRRGYARALEIFKAVVARMTP